MSIDKSLLLVVDIQKGFMNDETRKVVPKINQLVAAWKERECPVIYSRFVNLPGSNWEKLLHWHEMKAEPETLLAEDLAVASNFIFKKGTYSAWSDEVIAVCSSRHLTDIVIVGVDTNECVLATALAIFDAGYTPWIVADCCASSGGPEIHQTALTLLQALLGEQQVLTSEELL